MLLDDQEESNNLDYKIKEHLLKTIVPTSGDGETLFSQMRKVEASPEPIDDILKYMDKSYSIHFNKMSGQDYVIGAVSDLTWEQIEPWAISLVRSGYSGNKVVLAYNIDEKSYNNLIRLGFTIWAIKKSNDPNYKFFFKPKHSFNICVERFFHMWLFLTNMQQKHEIRYVISTDVRDVILQTNPITFMEQFHAPILLSSEGIKYEDEEWGRNNLTHSFGQTIYNNLKEKVIVNAGVIAGHGQAIIDLFQMIYLVSRSGPMFVQGGGGPDQAALNIIINKFPWNNIARVDAGDSIWACQLGTLWKPEYETKLVSMMPNYDSNTECFRNPFGHLYNIVHQYDRFNPQFAEKYRENKKDDNSNNTFILPEISNEI